MGAGSEIDVPELRIRPSDWPAAIASTDGPQIVVGGPGTGKTEFLVRRVLHLVEDRAVPAGSILVLSFSRRGTADLENRVRRGLSSSVPRIDVATFHSLASRVVESHAIRLGWQRPPELLTGPEQVDVVQRLLAGADRTRWSPPFRGLLGSATFAGEVTEFILRTREQVMSVTEVRRLESERDDWKGIGDFLSDYDRYLRSAGRVDYGTLLASAVEVLEGADEPGSVTRQLSHVLVDEYQDTTPAQARLLEALVPAGGNLTAAADPYQSIYSFRGADVRNVAEFPHRFRDTGGLPARRMVLTTSFRVPGEILAAAERVTGGDLPGAAGPVVPASVGGRVDVHRFEQETEEAEWIADEMQRMHLEDRIPYSSMGVFVRSKHRTVPDLVRALHRRGIPHEEPDARLSERAPARFVLDLVAAATGLDGPAGTARAIRRILLGPICSISLGTLRAVERARLADPMGSWTKAIRTAAPEADQIANLLENDEWATETSAADGLWRIWSALDAVSAVVSDPDRADEREAWASLSQVMRRWNERNPASTLADYRRLTEEEGFEARPLLSYRRPHRDTPTITTLHQCKGLEFDVVFIADAVEGVFPDLRTRDSLLGVRHLMAHLPHDTAGYRAFRLQEERRLAYTAMSRARRRVVWTATTAGIEEGRGRPSRFLALAAGTPTVAAAATPAPPHERPITPREAEGMLRRALADPALEPPRRLAALSVLISSGDGPLRSPLTYAGMLERGSDTAVIGPDHTMSPSQAEAYETCPRRYVLERHLRIGAASSVYLDFGSMLHAALESVERRAMAEGLEHASVGDALRAWRSAFDPAAFGGGPFAEAWLARGEAALRHLYDNWPGSGRAVAVERPLRLDLGGRNWRGRADRIEEDGDAIGIVDYKTSGSAARKADVEESLQLGFYVLAAGADPDLADRGPARRAEMWFPAAGGTTVKTRRFDMANLDRVRGRLGALAEGIFAEDWHPEPGAHCARCPVRPLCPAWLEGREAFL